MCVMDGAHLEVEKLASHAFEHVGSARAWFNARGVVEARSMQVAAAIVEHGNGPVSKPWLA